MKSWAPTHDGGKCRIAILWKPSRAPFDRWACLNHVILEGAGKPTRAGAGPGRLTFFVDEGEARAFLLADDPEAIGVPPAP